MTPTLVTQQNLAAGEGGRSTRPVPPSLGQSSHVDTGSPDSCSPVPVDSLALEPGGCRQPGESILAAGAQAQLGGLSFPMLTSQPGGHTQLLMSAGLTWRPLRSRRWAACRALEGARRQDPCSWGAHGRGAHRADPRGCTRVFPGNPLWSRPEPVRVSPALCPSSLFLKPVLPASTPGPLHVLPLCPQQAQPELARLDPLLRERPSLSRPV